MNTARFFRRLKRDIGLYGIALPIENLDQYIVDIVEDTTLPVFSIYQPRYEIVLCDSSTFTRADTTRGEDCQLYLLPDSLFAGREVLFVRDIEYASDLNNQYTGDYRTTVNSYGIATGAKYLEELMLANANKPIVDMMINRVTFHYEYPRQVYVYDALMSSRLKLTLACEHDTSLQSIPPTAAESFMDLAVLDVEAGLYNIVKPYAEISGAYDHIELKIDDWLNAKDKRKDLLSNWDEVYLLDQGHYDFG